jgi:Flp pilus assembly protein TadD
MFGRIPEPRYRRLAAIVAIALLATQARAASDLSPRQLMRFGVEAARQGLWREAVSRWERAVKDDGANPRLHNNLAVAYESLGRFDDAEREYAAARKLAPDSREIHDNQESFLQMHAAPRPAEGAAPPAAPAAAPAAEPPPTAALPPAKEPPPATEPPPAAAPPPPDRP